jgi:DNA-binding NtrC family response regulator
VTPVVKGKDALQLMNNQPFDLVFLDLVMPDLDGSELFERIRERGNDIPVAIITGYPDSNLMKKARELNPFLTIKKPLDFQDMLDAVYLFSQS